MKKRKYIWGYPRIVFGRLLSNVMIYCLCVGPFVVISALGVYAGIYIMRVDGFALMPLLLLLIMLPVLFITGIIMGIMPVYRAMCNLRSKELPVSLKAYRRDFLFAIPDPRDSRNNYGKFMAKHCKALDLVAERKGITPLYEFGIRQENEEEQVWFPTGQGVETIDKLLECIENTECQMPSGEEIQKDLEMMQAILKADKQFHLMLV